MSGDITVISTPKWPLCLSWILKIAAPYYRLCSLYRLCWLYRLGWFFRCLTCFIVIHENWSQGLKFQWHTFFLYAIRNLSHFEMSQNGRLKFNCYKIFFHLSLKLNIYLHIPIHNKPSAFYRKPTPHFFDSQTVHLAGNIMAFIGAMFDSQTLCLTWVFWEPVFSDAIFNGPMAYFLWCHYW